nr:integrase, catalytic region, zinc finger, CCHC-type, peptidase aspartic, catalytic [Tanacetum cinerariifolium]GFA21808.1 integrase, catalytic region, zinc finger, CCHC-type, peptidase aspartic, catalytic [Tanacetum cinerariifolium]
EEIDQNDDDNDLAKEQLARRNSKEYASQMKLDCAKVRGDLLSYKMDYHKSCTKYTDTINDLNQTISKMKDKLSAHQETISILSQQKEAQIKLYKTREDKELDKVIELENKVKFLKKVQRANPRPFDIGCYNDNLALMLAPDSDEVIRFEKESRSKLSYLIRPFDYDKLKNLYDLFVSQREKSSEQRYFSERSRLSHTSVNNGKSKESFHKQTTLLEKRMDESIQLDKQCQSSLEIFKVKSCVNTIITGVELCKQKIANKPQFQRCLNEEMVADLRYFNSLELEVDSLGSQLKTQKTQFLNEIDRLSREYYYADHMNAILSVYTELDEKIVSSESNKTPRNFTGKLYERVSKTCSWWYSKFTPSGYKWKPKFGKENVNPNVSMPLGNASRTANVMDTMTSRRSIVSNTPLSSNYFAAHRDCPIHHLEVVFRKSTCYIRDLKGNDLLTGSRETDLYSITLQDTNSPNPICLMAKATSSQAWLWHRRLSHLNFDTINLLSKNDIVVGLPKLKFVKDHLCSSCELGKAN